MAITGSSYRSLSSTKEKETTKSGCFAGLHFFIELGVISLQRKRGVTSAIESCGGSIDFVVSKQTTHVVSHPDVVGSYKIKSALAHGCLVVGESFVDDCVKANRKLDVKPYILIDSVDTTPKQKESPAETSTFVVSALARTYTPKVNAAIGDAVFNIAALCAGLGAQVPPDTFPLNSIVSNMYYNITHKKAPETRPEPVPKTVIPTPQFREITPRSTPSRADSEQTLGEPGSFRARFEPSLASGFGRGRFGGDRPVQSKQHAFPSRLSSPTPSVLSSTSTSSTEASTAQPKPATSAPSTSTYFSFPSKPSTSINTSPPPAETTFPSTPEKKAVSYSYAQFEEERRKKREEEKAKRAEESTSVLKEREARRKEEEEARKKNLEDKRLELLERRKLEDEERKQKQKEMSEAREKRIAEERRKREQVIEKLMQKPTHDLITTSFFQSLDQEENDKKMREEWDQYVKELEEAKQKEQEKERAAKERAEKLFAEKERKIQEKEESQKLAVAERARLKDQRRQDYERNKLEEEIRRKKEFEERQAVLLEAFLKRQAKRQKKALLKLHPVEEVNYDKQKIFVGGIKLDDIKSAKLAPSLARKVTDERINSILRMFDQFGPIHQRKVFADKGHCFITFSEKESVEKAVEGMKDAEFRKKLVEEAKKALAEKNMHKLCVPHPSFYVRVPTQQRKDKKKPKEFKTESDTSSQKSEDLIGFTRVTNPKGPQPASPSVPSSVPAAAPVAAGAPIARPPCMRTFKPKSPQLFEDPKLEPVPVSNIFDDLSDENDSDQDDEDSDGSDTDEQTSSEEDGDVRALFD